MYDPIEAGEILRSYCVDAGIDTSILQELYGVYYEPLYITDAQDRKRKRERPDEWVDRACFLCDLEEEKRIQEVLAVCEKEL